MTTPPLITAPGLCLRVGGHRRRIAPRFRQITPDGSWATERRPSEWPHSASSGASTVCDLAAERVQAGRAM